MLRLAAPGHRRLRQSLPGAVDATFAGSETNVAASLAMLGAEVSLVTAMPRNPIAEACIDAVRAVGVDTSRVHWSDIGRVGLYYLESGANQRPSRVTYDRDHSSVALTPAEAYSWRESLAGATWLHVSGVTPALSEAAAEATQAAVEQAKRGGVTVSCDLNFRGKLWRWKPGVDPRDLAEHVMNRLLPFVDVLIANEEDCSQVLGIAAEGSDIEAGRIVASRYEDVAARVVERFPKVQTVATTLRHSLSASHNDWGAMLYSAQDRRACFAPLRDGEYSPYPIKNIVDRVGGGDSFAAALIFALTTETLRSPQSAVAFAAAASCLAHSIPGDFNYSSRQEIETLMRGLGSGRVVR